LSGHYEVVANRLVVVAKAVTDLQGEVGMMAIARTSGHRVAVALAILLGLTSVFTMSGCGGQVSSEALVEERCTGCHTLAPIEVAQKTVEEWEFTVYRMTEKGARLNGRQAQEVIDYLSSVYGADSP
jgi:hypothetical protein